MSKTITIPEDYKPNYICEINGVKYSYPAGQTVEVPDDVAEIIENDIALNPTPAPKVAQSDLFKRNTYVFDGNTAGLTHVFSPQYGDFYKISSATLTDNEISQGGTVTLIAQGMSMAISLNMENESDGMWTDVGMNLMMVAQRDNVYSEYLEALFPEKGIYVMWNPEMGVESFSFELNGYNGFPPIPQIDPKYLPQSGGETVLVFAQQGEDNMLLFKDEGFSEVATTLDLVNWITNKTRVIVMIGEYHTSEVLRINALGSYVEYIGSIDGDRDDTVFVRAFVMPD